MIDASDRTRLQSIERELLTVRLDAPALGGEALEEIRTLTELDGMAVYSLRQQVDHWRVDRFLATALLSTISRRFFEVFHRADRPIYYNPLAPAADQRNRVVDALAWIEEHAPGTWENSPMCRHVLSPAQLDRHHQPRVLLCEGPQVLAWFGGFSEDAPTARQLELMTALIEPVRRRLLAEQRLGVSALERATLELVLDGLGTPAFVVDLDGLIQLVNRSGQVLLEERRRDVSLALHAAIHGRPSKLAFELMPIHARGVSPSWLATLRVDTLEQRIAKSVRVCAIRWGLTPRQTEVLELVVRGNATATIAAAFACSERSVELHITKLFDRANVESRAGLVAAVLTS